MVLWRLVGSVARSSLLPRNSPGYVSLFFQFSKTPTSLVLLRLVGSVARRSLLPRNSPNYVYRYLINASYRRNLSTAASRVCSSFPPNQNGNHRKDWWSSSTFGARLIHGTAYRAEDYFETLGVSRNATQSDIKKAYFQVKIIEICLCFLCLFIIALFLSAASKGIASRY
ncbi:hypothetical protein LINGRAHAP2_LOCUS15837 [Linum grandiflorum]